MSNKTSNKIGIIGLTNNTIQSIFTLAALIISLFLVTPFGWVALVIIISEIFG